jgi:hypothetical protein
MFQPEKVERDRYGFWLHSALRNAPEDVPITDLPDSVGMEFSFVSFESDAPDEQYAGWARKIDARTGADANGKLTVEAAALVLAACATESGEQFSSVLIQADKEQMERAYKVAAKEVHPDRGGSESSMARVNEAAGVLRSHFGNKQQGARA